MSLPAPTPARAATRRRALRALAAAAVSVSAAALPAAWRGAAAQSPAPPAAFPAPALPPGVLPIAWRDLIPPVDWDDPFAALSQEVLMHVNNVAHYRELIARGEQPDALTRQVIDHSTRELQRLKVDPEPLLKRRLEVMERRRLHREKVVPELNGRTIRMPGYLLPLDGAGAATREYLLVPWVGACIHTPAPPPNQVLYVRLDPGVSFTPKGAYTAVWITGVLSARGATHKLTYVDGSTDVPVGYSLRGTGVEDFKR